MKLHPRHKAAQVADLRFSLALTEIIGEFDLTPVEIVQMLSKYISTELKYMLREERHGNSTTPADQAGE